MQLVHATYVHSVTIWRFGIASPSVDSTSIGTTPSYPTDNLLQRSGRAAYFLICLSSYLLPCVNSYTNHSYCVPDISIPRSIHSTHHIQMFRDASFNLTSDFIRKRPNRRPKVSLPSLRVSHTKFSSLQVEQDRGAARQCEFEVFHYPELMIGLDFKVPPGLCIFLTSLISSG
ncbi:hypothetical protein L210DRAFT_122233 [Boletus edulis BED1]|uniref:Uncharacterized protein n=1 Tax=Boletus edulis BED1 TaxID=1328754 RepID=A0AAD4GBU0_BOLED|nr:hypothetical protein L210DRAFT_122233 [Boletus edulis BED1]